MTNMTKKLVLAFSMLALLKGAAMAQSANFGDTTAQITGLRSDSGGKVTTEWAAFSRMNKTKQLLAFAKAELGCTVTPQPSLGFVNTQNLVFTRSGSSISGTSEVRMTFMPLNCVATRYRGASVALGLVRYMSTPQLAFPRLFVRYGNNGIMVEEFSYRRDNKVIKMGCKTGDCVFRTALLLIEQRNSAAFKSLNAVLQSGTLEVPFTSLQRLYDTRKPPVGQGTLALYSGLMIASNLEEEFYAGYIDGALDQSLKPVRTEPWYITEAKKALKDAMKDIVKQGFKAFLCSLGLCF